MVPLVVVMFALEFRAFLLVPLAVLFPSFTLKFPLKVSVTRRVICLVVRCLVLVCPCVLSLLVAGILMAGLLGRATRGLLIRGRGRASGVPLIPGILSPIDDILAHRHDLARFRVSREPFRTMGTLSLLLRKGVSSPITKSSNIMRVRIVTAIIKFRTRPPAIPKPTLPHWDDEQLTLLRIGLCR